MKKLITLVSIVVLAAWIGFGRSQPDKQVTKERSRDLTPTATPMVYSEISSGGQIYSYLLLTNITADSLRLFDNTTAKKSSRQIMPELACDAGINGGFYGTDDKPVGWMVINKELISRAKKSELMNGFIVIQASRLKIQYSVIEGAVYALQTGPILITDGQAWKLSLARDKPARRMVMGTTADKVFVLAVFDSEADMSGPNLVDLPMIVEAIGRKEGLGINTAVNLDGGSASAIYTPEGHLEETSPVGSWWCINNADGQANLPAID